MEPDRSIRLNRGRQREETGRTCRDSRGISEANGGVDGDEDKGAALLRDPRKAEARQKRHAPFVGDDARLAREAPAGLGTQRDR